MEDARTRSKTFVDNAIARAFGRGRGEFQIDGSFGIAFTGYIEPRLERARQRFLGTLSRETGIPLWREAAVNQVHFTIHTSGPSLPIQQLGEDESYHLMISATSVQLSAANPLGVTHGRRHFSNSCVLRHVDSRFPLCPLMTLVPDMLSENAVS